MENHVNILGKKKVKMCIKNKNIIKKILVNKQRKVINYILGKLNMFGGVLNCLHLLFTHAFAGSDIDVLGCNVIEASGQKISLSVSIWTENWKPIK
jgi:hypothetical protein